MSGDDIAAYLARLQSLLDVAAECRVTKPTVWGWVVKGLVIGSRRVKLAAVRIGGQWKVHPDALAVFVRECNPAAKEAPESPAALVRRGRAAKEAAARILGGER